MCKQGNRIIARKLHIAFYAPLKAASHPVPSGDRRMARLLTRCLEGAGHRVTQASDLRAYLRGPDDAAGWADLQARAAVEKRRIVAGWAAAGPPDLWFCYHPYYKSPDLIGPPLAENWGLPYVTCEASYSDRRNVGIWAEMQALALRAVERAAMNLCVTQRDMDGLRAAAPAARLVRFPPFLETDGFDAPPAPRQGHIVCVAMMRQGDKLDSYHRLAATLALLPQGLEWHLSVAGDGPMRAAVQALFVDLPQARLSWLGEMDAGAVAQLLATGAVYAWPGCGEAYGLAYLEAQAAGLPVVAQAIAGVPEVVMHGVTGFLTPAGDDAAAAAAITRLLTDAPLQRRMGRAARDHVAAHHALPDATGRLDALLQDVMR